MHCHVLIRWVRCYNSYIQQSVSIATGYELDDRMIGVRTPVGAGNFYLRHHVQTGSRAHRLVSGALSLGVKRPGREADHLPPSSAAVKE
jgi:hypothetical protein